MSTIVPITVFTGFLGAGKTSIILAVTKRVPPNYKIVVLKNEFGDVKVDSELVRESNLQVTEMLNGCMCCVLVGQMRNALVEIQETYRPDRIIVETSGSAFPAPIAWQIRELRKEGLPFVLDAIITVVDCVNFMGYEDTSYTAKMQAKYSDVIVLNKWELVSPRAFDLVLDRVNDLNDLTPKIRSDRDMKGVDPDVVFGLDTRLFEEGGEEVVGGAGGDGGMHWDGEVDVVRVGREWVGARGGSEVDGLGGEGNVGMHVVEVCEHDHNHNHDHSESCVSGADTEAGAGVGMVDTSVGDLQELSEDNAHGGLDPIAVTDFLSTLDKEEVFRVKGFVALRGPVDKEGLEKRAPQGSFLSTAPLSSGGNGAVDMYILNWAFGRWTWTWMSGWGTGGSGNGGSKGSGVGPGVVVRLSVFGLGLRIWTEKIRRGFGFASAGKVSRAGWREEVVLTEAKR
ncbi:hypothetical protein HDU93_009254 [Gonapodya sp. JEL0774]|nr:hypothetical protein HDU93_009254 [Gonapodya sp. JEL0774]